MPHSIPDGAGSELLEYRTVRLVLLQLQQLVSWPNDLGGIDVNRACHDQYPGWNLHAVLAANNIFGWRCAS